MQQMNVSMRVTLCNFMFNLYAGCGKLWVTDGVWKLAFPHCLYHVEASHIII